MSALSWNCRTPLLLSWMAVDRKHNQREELEAWWAFVARILFALVGIALLLIEATGEGQRFMLIAAGVVLCGPVAAQGLATVLSSARGSAPGNGAAP